jgi:hypothetical protein
MPMTFGRFLLVALALGACARGAPIENQVTVTGANFGNVMGEARLAVRTFLPDEGGERREVIGAACELETSLYSTPFTTPVRLKLPNFGPQSPELDFTCKANEWSGAAVAEISANWDYPPGGYGYGGYGYYGPGYYGGPYGWGPAGGWGWPGGAVVEYYYPNVDVPLR